MYTIYENYIYTRYSLHMFLNFDELCQFAKRQELPGMRRRFRQDVTLIHAQAEISTASNLLKKLFFSESVAIDQNLKDLLYWVEWVVSPWHQARRHHEYAKNFFDDLCQAG